MDKTSLLRNLSILSNAQVGHKLSKSTGEWYSSSGWMSGLYRTISGESRNDILELMDNIIKGLKEFQDSTDVQAKNEIILAIGEAMSGCDKIMETYRGDEKFIEEFSSRMHEIAAFKEPRVRNANIPIERIKLRNYQTAYTHLLTNQRRIGVDYINSLIKPETIDNKDTQTLKH